MMILLWVKAFHIVAMVCWFAVLFYLPRLFVYHAMSEDSISRERFTLMEGKLLRGIGHPAMIATYVFGIWLASYNIAAYHKAPWFMAKIACVIALTIYHHLCVRYWKQFRDNKNTHSHVYYRWFNEVPVVLLIVIVCLVVIKPI